MRILLLLLLIFIGCRQSANEGNKINDGSIPPETVHIRHYSWLDSINEKLANILSIVKEKDTINYIYRRVDFPDSLYSYKISKEIGNDSVLKFLKSPVPLLDERFFEINGKQVSIAKYDYDKPGIVDEELYVYFNDNYGLILLKSRAWGDVISFEKKTSESKALFDFLDDDTTGFYKRR